MIRSFAAAALALTLASATIAAQGGATPDDPDPSSLPDRKV
jgi:hypothetical protein